MHRDWPLLMLRPHSFAMDAAFLMEEPFRANFFRSLMQSFGCVYVCLWSYFPHPSNCLISLDGYYNEAEDQPSTSSGSLARRLFEEYRQSVIPLDNGHVPGMAFRNNRPYIELRDPEIQRLACNDLQRLFYQESRIQTTVFMGCRSGEIELGLSYSSPNINMEMGLREWFPEDFRRQSPIGVSQTAEQTLQLSSPSSSSLRSLDSSISEYSPLILPTISPRTPQIIPETNQDAALAQIQTLVSMPMREKEDETMAKAILAVLSSPSTASSTSSSSQQQQQQQQHQRHVIINRRASAFKRYSAMRASSGLGIQVSARGQSMARRAISYYRGLSVSQRGPTSTQLHHMIAERKRREKLNDSFQALRLLLPQGTKKDKASVLTSAREHLTLLKDQVAKLVQRNQELQAQLEAGKDHEVESVSFSERFDVRIRHLSESSSEERMVDLRVIVRGECESVDLVIRLLEFLKGINSMSLVSIEARREMREATSFSHVSLRLRIEGAEWDESPFREAVRRIVADVAK